MFWRSNRPAIFWGILVLILCGFPGDKLPQLTFLEWLRPDKIVHLILFGVQCYLLLRGFKSQSSYPTLRSHAGRYAVLISITYGGLVEVLQEYVFIHRSGDIRDAAANALGAFIGLWIFNRLHPVLNVNPPHKNKK